MVEGNARSLGNPERNLQGLSTDTKPTANAHTGDTFYELNTGKSWIFSELNINPVTSNGWWEV